MLLAVKTAKSDWCISICLLSLKSLGWSIIILFVSKIVYCLSIVYCLTNKGQFFIVTSIHSHGNDHDINNGLTGRTELCL